MNDGSTDGSGAILDEYAAKDSRFRVFHQANAGVSAARNKALDVAKGEWLLFVDADDWIDPMYLQDFVYREDKADVTFFPGIVTYPDGMHKVLSGPADGFKGLIYQRLLKCYNIVCGVGLFNIRQYDAIRLLMIKLQNMLL